jgi:hypothetical protein
MRRENEPMNRDGEMEERNISEESISTAHEEFTEEMDMSGANLHFKQANNTDVRTDYYEYETVAAGITSPTAPRSTPVLLSVSDQFQLAKPPLLPKNQNMINRRYDKIVLFYPRSIKQPSATSLTKFEKFLKGIMELDGVTFKESRTE